MRVSTDSTRVWSPCGCVKSLTPWWNSLVSKRQSSFCTSKFRLHQHITMRWFNQTLFHFRHVVPKPRDQCSKGEQLVVTFAAGYIAGVFCAIVSHPADTVVSKMNAAKGSTAGETLKKLGFVGMWQGLTPRIIMIGTLTALQWFIYDAVKVWLALPRPPPPEMPESLKKKLAAAQH